MGTTCASASPSASDGKPGFISGTVLDPSFRRTRVSRYRLPDRLQTPEIAIDLHPHPEQPAPLSTTCDMVRYKIVRYTGSTTLANPTMIHDSPENIPSVPKLCPMATAATNPKPETHELIGRISGLEARRLVPENSASKSRSAPYLRMTHYSFYGNVPASACSPSWISMREVRYRRGTMESTSMYSFFAW